MTRLSSILAHAPRVRARPAHAPACWTVFAWCLLAACNGGSVISPEPECDSNADCTQQACIDAACVDVDCLDDNDCEADSECSDDHECVQPQGPSGECEDCEAPYACDTATDTCTFSCIVDGSCSDCEAQTDADGDGLPACVDGCPDDANKSEAGACGCGAADVDSDGDLTLDCNDGCPQDPSKTAPGTCGCGEADADADSDGTLDCNDGCPGDGDKTAPGTCGCGVADVDQNSNGTVDCLETCPDNPDKETAGACGCDVLDTDSDTDGTPDCIDDCPDDGEKVLPGVCGCGESEADVDQDSTADCVDTCVDKDEDGYGAEGHDRSGCSSSIADCRPEDASSHFGADEVCDGVDNDCDFAVDGDDLITKSNENSETRYYDGDGDGYGITSETRLFCVESAEAHGYVSESGDCLENDTTSGEYTIVGELTNPGADERCGDGFDNNCNQSVDESACTAVDDDDKDGYIDEAAGGTDCDDSDPNVNPGTPEVCDNNLDDNCNDATDAEDPSLSDRIETYYQDGDGDGFGSSATGEMQRCFGSAEWIEASEPEDCDDTDVTVYPGAPELCDAVQNDCEDSTWSSDDGLVSFHPDNGDAPYSLTDAFSNGGEQLLDAAGTLYLCPGTHGAHVSVTVGNVSVVGVGEGVVLDAEAQGSVVDVGESGLRRIENITLQNGDATEGGGIACDGGRLELTDVVIRDSVADRGGGLHASQCTLDFSGVTINNNTATSHSGGLYVSLGSLQWSDGKIDNNSAPDYGALYLSNTKPALVTNHMQNVQILGNTTTSGLYLIYIVQSFMDFNCGSSGGFFENEYGDGSKAALMYINGIPENIADVSFDGCRFGPYTDASGKSFGKNVERVGTESASNPFYEIRLKNKDEILHYHQIDNTGITINSFAETTYSDPYTGRCLTTNDNCTDGS